MSGGDWKAMFKGIQEGDFELVSYYLKTGIDPNYQHPEYMALPLAESIRYDRLAIAELLLQHGAKHSIIEMESGATTLALAQKKKDQRFIDLLNEFVDGVD